MSQWQPQNENNSVSQAHNYIDDDEIAHINNTTIDTISPFSSLLRKFNNDIKLLDERIIKVENRFEDDEDIHESNANIDLDKSRLVSQQATINLIVQEQMTDQCKFTPRNLMNEQRFANTLFDKNEEILLNEDEEIHHDQSRDHSNASFTHNNYDTYPDEEYGNVEWSNLHINVNVGVPWSTLNPRSKEWKPKATEACQGRAIKIKPRNNSGPTEIITTQNVRSLWRNRRDENGRVMRTKNPEGKSVPVQDNTKEEKMIDKMVQDGIGAMLVQETWKEGNHNNVEIGDTGCYMFSHNREIGKGGKDHLYRGVAIILSPSMHEAWREGGSKPPITTDSKSKHGGRFISLYLKFNTYDTRGKRIAGKSTSFNLTSVYHPHDEKECDEFNEILEEKITKAKQNKGAIIMGADINAKLGVRDGENYKDILGPNGFDDRNSKGEHLLDIYGSHNLRVAHTYCTHDNYTTFVSLGDDKTPSTHDIFAVSKELHGKVHDCKVISDGAESDHSAMAIRISVRSIKWVAKESKSELTDWTSIASDEELREKYNSVLKELLDDDDYDDDDYDQFNEYVNQAGAATKTYVKKKCAGWFQFSREELSSLLEQRNNIISTLRHTQDLPQALIDSYHEEKNLLQKLIDIETSLAKSKWYAHHSAKIHDMAFNPRLAWESIKILNGGDTAHHIEKKVMALKLPNGKLAENDAENQSVMHPHLNKVYNNTRPVDYTVLELIEQRAIMEELDAPFTWKEFSNAVNGLKNCKAPGLNGVPPEAFKAMDSECRRYVFDFLTQYFDGESDYESWHKSQCVPVPKSGDLSDPNKWRGVSLMDLQSKIFSCMMNVRAFKILDKHGTKWQFGGTPKLGCADGLFTLKTLLNMRKNHNLQTHVCFVDLVKAYDTADHKLLVKVLEKYGAPPKFCSAVERMYTDLKVVLKIGKEMGEVLQSVGVRQGDNMAPVLFLFLMTAFAESLEKEYDRNNIKKIELHRASDEDLISGNAILKSHKPKQYSSTGRNEPKLKYWEAMLFLYVDDGAFPFATREEMTQGATVIFDHFARFGLEMHLGYEKDGKIQSSKTECVFFPTPQYFDKMEVTATLENGNENQAEMTIASKRSKESEEAKMAREDACYDRIDETQPVNVRNGFMTYTKHFKYLGSHISYSLQDDYDIKSRIAAATKAFGALTKFWYNRHVDTYSKYLIFRAIPMNLLLWGCEAWSLRKSLLMKLEVFLTRNIRRILKISMFQVKRERITNDQVRKRFYDIPCVENMIAARLLSFIGKAVRDPCPLRPAKLMLTTCCNNNRKRGRPYTTNKDTIVNCLVLLFERVPEVAIDQNQGSMIDWVKEVNKEKYWKSLIRCLLKSDEEIPTRPTDEGWNQTPRPQPQPAPCPTPERRRQRRQRSTRRTRPNQSSNSNPPPPPGSPPQRRQQAPPPPPSPRRDREPPPQRAEHRERDWIAANVGKVRYDSLRILGLREGATEGEVKAAYRAMSRIYHPDKHNSGFTGMSDEEAVEFFQHLNNAHSYLREIM